MADQKLDFSLGKTEAMILKGSAKRNGIKYEWKNLEIVPSKTLRYFSVRLDTNMVITY